MLHLPVLYNKGQQVMITKTIIKASTNKNQIIEVATRNRETQKIKVQQIKGFHLEEIM